MGERYEQPRSVALLACALPQVQATIGARWRGFPETLLPQIVWRQKIIRFAQDTGSTVLGAKQAPASLLWQKRDLAEAVTFAHS